ncbi:MAG: HEAT repeat domain-containing protein, partial [Planctomycetaceae bacterium]|nr:HEAT repeat domain-containing protein [Planctomycetaceae bacterium]
YSPQNSANSIDARLERAFTYEVANFNPVANNPNFPLYFYYAVERAFALSDKQQIAGRDWYEAYGDGLASMQGEDGSWNSPRNGKVVGTAFALLYYMRSTGEIISKLLKGGRLKGGHDLFGKKKDEVPSDIGQLMNDITQKIPWETLDEQGVEFTNELIRSIESVDDPSVWVGRKEELRTLSQHPDASIRAAMFIAIGDTGDFALIPVLLKGLRDVNVDTAAEAQRALCKLSRRPNGFGLAANAFDGMDIRTMTDQEKLTTANIWRDRTFKAWSEWYYSVRPYEDRDGLEDLLGGVK